MKKKIFTYLILSFMLLGLCACTKTETNDTTTKNTDKTTEEQMAKVLLDLKNAMDKAGVTFCSVDCQLENNDAETWLEVRNFLYSDIYEEDLIERVKKSVKETKEYYEAIDKEAEVVLDEK